MTKLNLNGIFFYLTKWQNNKMFRQFFKIPKRIGAIKGINTRQIKAFTEYAMTHYQNNFTRISAF